jgi:hypothetical protein
MKTLQRKLVRSVRPRHSINGRNYYNNNFDVFNANVWAREAMRIYYPNMVLGNLVSRDFDNDVHKFGDVVNAIVPGQFTMQRKGALCEALTVQDGNASSIQVALNQMPYVSFRICDGEEDRGLLDLVNTMLIPAVQALSLGVDTILATQAYQFLDYEAGHLGNLSESNIRQYITEAGLVMDNNNMPETGRSLILGPNAKASALNTDLFVKANDSGSNQTLRKGIIGSLFGFENVAVSQGVPYIPPGQATQATTTTAAAAAGATILAATAVTGLAAGMWLVAVGDDTPQQIVSISSLNITITPGLKRAVASGAAITAIKGGAVNHSGGYYGTTTSPHVVGWAKDIVTNSWTGIGPKKGQMVTFGTDTTKYAIINVTAVSGGFSIMLDKPLVTAIADTATVNLGPAGQYNLGIMAKGMAMVNRPLPKPRTGALSSVINQNNLSLRVVITYDGNTQSHLVTVDTLMGVGMLDHTLGVVLLG